MNSLKRKRESADAHRIAYLDGLRALAIAAVVMLHWGAAYTPFGGGGQIGVTMFLVLSGYLITTILWRSGISYRKFLWKRVIRLYPALLGVLILTPLLATIVPRSGVLGWEALHLALVALIQGTALWAIMNFNQQHNLLIVTWSLSVEWFFYILWAPVLTGLKRVGQSPVRVSGWCWATAALLWIGSMPLPNLWAYFGPTLNSAALLAGAAIALMLIDRPSAPAWWSGIGGTLLSSLGCALFAYWVVFGTGDMSILSRALVTPLVCALSILLILTGRWCENGIVARTLSWRPLVTLGQISYSLYLWHSIPQYLLTPESLPLSKPTLGLIGIVATAILTLLTYRFLERPFTRSRTQSINGQNEPAVIDLRPSTVETEVGSAAHGTLDPTLRTRS